MIAQNNWHQTTLHVFALFAHRICNKYEWWHTGDFLYHFTSRANARDILVTQCICAQNARIQCFGIGVFMTEMSPMASDQDLLVNNYRGNSKYYDRIQCAFAFRKRDSFARKFFDLTNFSRDLWRCDASIDLSRVDFFLIDRSEVYTNYCILY
jgi:hypothetical protein